MYVKDRRSKYWGWTKRRLGGADNEHLLGTGIAIADVVTIRSGDDLILTINDTNELRDERYALWPQSVRQFPDRKTVGHCIARWPGENRYPGYGARTGIRKKILRISAGLGTSSHKAGPDV